MRIGDVRCIDMDCRECPLKNTKRICKVNKAIRAKGKSDLKPKKTVFNVLGEPWYLPYEVKERYKKELNKEYKGETND